MEKRVNKQIGIREEVAYPFKAGLDPRDQGGNQLTGEKSDQGESIIPAPDTRPSTGKLSKYPYETKREGVVKK